MYRPLQSLEEGCWFKLICGASFQHLPAVRSLALAYALAGADCIDVAADPAVVTAARAGLKAAANLRAEAVVKGYWGGQPWLMVSLNDGEDPHFRKAEFAPESCPSSCPRPCVSVCPVQAIVFEQQFAGVLESLCYGCGRCLPICPVQQITARSYIYDPAAVAPLVLSGVDALEIHTQVGRMADFSRLWQAVAPYLAQLKLVSISCPDGEGLIDYLKALYDLISPLPCALVWQTDGRPMSGDLGDGATRAAVKLGQKVLAAGLSGYVQLAGGTNRHTIQKLRSMQLLNASAAKSAAKAAQDTSGSSPPRQIAGIAYGSYARSILAPILERLEHLEHREFWPELAGPARDQAMQPPTRASSQLESPQSPSAAQPAMTTHLHPTAWLEDYPELLWQAVARAHDLVCDLKPGASGSKPSRVASGTSLGTDG